MGKSGTSGGQWVPTERHLAVAIKRLWNKPQGLLGTGRRGGRGNGGGGRGRLYIPIATLSPPE